jgi:type II secretory pathway component PulM
MMSWWSARAPRERFLLSAALVIALLATLVQFVLVPAIQRRAEAETRVAEAASTLLRLERLYAAGITQAPTTPPADPGAAASALAAESGLTPSPAAPGAPALNFVFASTDPQQVFAWIAQAETRLGLKVQSAELSAAEPGRVNAAITFAEVSAP